MRLLAAVLLVACSKDAPSTPPPGKLDATQADAAHRFQQDVFSLEFVEP